MDKSTTQRFGKYEVVSTLGQGAMGVVYEGYDAALNRRVAIKTLQMSMLEEQGREESLARFKREAQAAGRLNHPGIVTVYDYGEENDIAYFVMEYLQGQPLDKLLVGSRRFAIDDICSIMMQILDALDYAHRQQVVHRDIKPANLMVVDPASHTIKITDFGIARIDSTQLTQVGMVVGTPCYMSPEQFIGKDIDSRSDIYSCGVLMYQLLTGERPFVGSVATIMHQAINQSPDNPSTKNPRCSAEVDRVVQRAMAKKPEDRYQTAAQFKAAVQALAGGASPPDDHADDEGTQIRPAADAAGTAGEGRSGKAKAVFLMLSLLGLVLGGWYVFQRPQDHNPSAPMAQAATGSIAISTYPEGATIGLAEGTALGVSPQEIALAPGKYDIVISKEGYHDVRANILVQPGAMIPFYISLTAR